MNFNRLNPVMFFVSKAQILEARDAIDKYRARLEAAKNIDSKIYLLPEEIEKIKRYNSIVSVAVHPDTKEIIPFYMKLSGFVVFNMPLVFMVLFAKQTPVFNAGA